MSCASVAGTGGGTVTSVGTGAGLTGGRSPRRGRWPSPREASPRRCWPTASVSTSKLPDGTVTGAKLASNSVDSTKIVDGSIGSVDVNASQIQLRVSGTCAVGNAIRTVNQDGTVSCQSVGSGGGVASVTASAPLQSSGGSSPDISLPNVIIGDSNTAVGTSALASTTGPDNTALGHFALLSNISGRERRRRQPCARLQLRQRQHRHRRLRPDQQHHRVG